MILFFPSSTKFDCGIPRESGDDPENVFTREHKEKYSPRERG